MSCHTCYAWLRKHAVPPLAYTMACSMLTTSHAHAPFVSTWTVLQHPYMDDRVHPPCPGASNSTLPNHPQLSPAHQLAHQPCGCMSCTAPCAHARAKMWFTGVKETPLHATQSSTRQQPATEDWSLAPSIEATQTPLGIVTAVCQAGPAQPSSDSKLRCQSCTTTPAPCNKLGSSQKFSSAASSLGLLDNDQTSADPSAARPAPLRQLRRHAGGPSSQLQPNLKPLTHHRQMPPRRVGGPSSRSPSQSSAP